MVSLSMPDKLVKVICQIHHFIWFIAWGIIDRKFNEWFGW